MSKSAIVCWALVMIGLARFLESHSAEAVTQQTEPKANASVHAPALTLPTSSFLTPEAQRAVQEWTKRVEGPFKACPYDPARPFARDSIEAIRGCFEEKFWIPLIAEYRSRYGVDIKPDTIGGVHVEIITPTGGVLARNSNRVLINLHGGGFIAGARYAGEAESIPIAAMGKLRIVSIDYRLAPEHKFPAATDDVVSVYRGLLKSYKSADIGIYGCSAGAVLTAQTVARLMKDGAPLPGAIGMFCSAGSYWSEGDSGYLQAALAGVPREAVQQHPYFEGIDPNDPLVFPARSTEVLSKFPPSLLISATRDLALSSVVHMHSQLVALGVEAELHIWEGLGHGFFYDPSLPQSREMQQVTVAFFGRHLGGEPDEQACGRNLKH